jgi:hypothetical protein
MENNPFIKPNQNPLVVTIVLPRDISSFEELNEVTSALNDFEKLCARTKRRNWPFPKSQYNPRINTHVASFRVNSPPEFTIIIDPSWLSLFLALVVGYKPMKESVGEMNRDTKKILRAIHGLTMEEIDYLRMAIRMAADGIQEMEVNAKRSAAEKIQRIAQRLLGDSGGEVKIRVKHLDD